MNLLRIALRNLGRSPARTALSILAVAASVTVVLSMKGLIDGILDTMEESTVRFLSGHVRVIDREYEARERLLSLQYPVDGFAGEGYTALVDSVAALDGVTVVAPRIRFGGMISRDDELQGVMVVAGEPELERSLLRVERHLAEGRFVQAGAREAVLGRRLLNRLGLSVGDRFTMVFSTSFGALRGYTFTVVGAFESSLSYLNDGTVFIPLDVAQAALDMDGAVTEVLVFAASPGDTPSIHEAVTDLLAGRGADQRYRAVPWFEHSEFMQFLHVGRRIYDVIYIGLLFLASVVVINTFVMIVNERRQEIGMLGALGLRPAQIRTLFLLEGGLCGLFGSLAGAVFGALLVAGLSRTGIAMPGIELLDAELMYPAVLYPVFDAEVVLYAFIGGIVVTLIAVFFPASHAARLRPTEALRG